MFCWNCGKELTGDSQFCDCCDAPVVNTEELLAAKTKLTPTPDSEKDTHISPGERLTETAESANTEQPPQEEFSAEASASAPVDTTAAKESSGTPDPTPETQPVPKDLIIRKKRIMLTGTRLQINGSYYQKKKRSFKKTKGRLEIPLSFITASSMLHNRCMGKAIATLLLFVLFTAGALTGGYFSLGSLEALNTPFHQEQISELEESLNRLEGISDADLRTLEVQLTQLQTNLEQTEAQLADYINLRSQEQLRRAVSNLSLDYSAVLADEFFEKAYDQYIEDLLDTFKNDELLNSWLYPYYIYTLKLGTNRYITENNNLDMWFYDIPGGREKFAHTVKDLDALELSVHDFNLYDRLYYHGRIYITASDFMNTVLYMPNYVADSAVFVRAFGGNPDPATMSVPGWNSPAYSDFWYNAESYYSMDEPIWVDYNLSAEDFGLDWNQLVNEQAYYDAYIKFMNTVAPGLATYDMVTYYASDDAYGGMGFDITGKEASATEIIALYLGNYPDALEQFDIDLNAIATSYDTMILDTQAMLDSLSAQTKKLEEEHTKLADFLERGDILRAEYNDLLGEKQVRDREFTRTLWIFGCMTVFLGMMSLICLFAFIHFAKQPRHLLVFTLCDGDIAAFSTAFCSKQKLEDLQKRLSISQ